MSTIANYETVSRRYVVKEKYLTKSGEIKTCEYQRIKSYVRKSPLKRDVKKLMSTLTNEQLNKVNEYIKTLLNESSNVDVEK
jgi:hypothetical protein